MSDHNNNGHQSPSGQGQPPPPPPASTRPRAVSNPQPVPGTLGAASHTSSEARDVMPDMPDMPTLASSFSANNALAPGLPASLPRSHIAQVLENYLVSTSPRSNNAAGIPLGSTPPGSALNPNSDSGSNTPLLERRRTSSIARNTPTPSVRALPLNGGSSSNGASPIPPRTRRISTALGILPAPTVAAPPTSNTAQPTGPGPSTDDDELVAAQLLDPSIGSPAFALLSGFAVRDVYKYREQPIINRVVHGRRRAKSMSSVPKGIARALHVRFSDDGKSKHSASASSGSPTLVPVSVDEDIEVPNPTRPLHLLRARDLLVPGGLRRFYLVHMDPRRHERVAAAISRRVSSAQHHGRSSSLPSDGRPVLTQLAPTNAKTLTYGTIPSSSDAAPHRRSATFLSDAHTPLLRSPPPTPYGLLPTRSFFDFLAMGYQQYGGAALWDEDELEDWGIPAPRIAPPAGSAAWGSGLLGFGALVDEEEVGLFMDQDEQEAGLGEGAMDESSALLGGGSGRRVLSRASSRAASLRSPLIAPSGPGAQPVGTASSRKAFLLLIKASIGTGVLFLPSAFKDGGLTFSFLFLILIAWLSARGMLLLAKVNLRVPGSFGDIAETLYGPVLRYMVLASITMSQMGFCAAYIVFIGQNLLGLLKQMNLSPSWALGPHGMAYLIAIQVCVYIPMALVRKIKAFAGFSLIGDVFILGGLAVVCAAAFSTMAEQGGPSPDVVHFNKQSFPLFIGTAVYTFEGVGLVIPIAQSMRNPRNFGRVLTAVMAVATAVYLFVASCGYLAWGNKVETIVLLNLPQSGVAQAVFILYIIAIVFTWPLVLFPVARILEQGLLPHASGKHSAWHKWQKNALRTGLVLTVATLALAGADALNKLVALIGSFACIPLSFLYPTMFHWRVFPDAGLGTKILDRGMFVFGIVAMVYVTCVTILM